MNRTVTSKTDMGNEWHSGVSKHIDVNHEPGATLTVATIGANVSDASDSPPFRKVFIAAAVVARNNISRRYCRRGIA